MFAKVSIQRSFPALTDLKLVQREDMREIGLLARERIIRRTRQGQGVEGSFEPYSADYAATKRAALGTAAVNLTVSGNMLNQLVIVDLSETSVTLGWNQ
jgi:hypothetical protein